MNPDEFLFSDMPIITAEMPYDLALDMITIAARMIALSICRSSNIIDPISTADDLADEIRSALRDSSTILFPIFDELDPDQGDDDLSFITPILIANAINALIHD